MPIIRHAVELNIPEIKVRHTGVTDNDVEGILRRLTRIENLLSDFQTKGIKVAESPEVAAFREQVTGALDNIAADIQRLLDRPNSLSEEDKQALAAIAQKAADVSNVVPE